MSLVSKITPGPWKAVPWHIMEGNPAVQAPDGHLICETSCNDDAELIAEAGTVAHETGLSPRELAEQRAELLAALDDVVEIIDKAGLLNLCNGVELGSTVWYVKASERFDYARATIAKCRSKPTPTP